MAHPLQARGLSLRRSCALCHISRSSWPTARGFVVACVTSN
jgi:hypothetical protein